MQLKQPVVWFLPSTFNHETQGYVMHIVDVLFWCCQSVHFVNSNYHYRNSYHHKQEYIIEESILLPSCSPVKGIVKTPSLDWALWSVS